MEKTLIVIAGPTASGKTALAVKLAQQYQTAILSADSRQFYREMTIGTAKPTPAELAAAPHYFINSHSVKDNFSVGDFEKKGLEILDDIFKNKDVALLAGGSGLYIKAICEGFDDVPSAPPEIRARLNQLLFNRGIVPLQEQLKLADPDYYRQVDLHNPQRIIRALEVVEFTGKPFSSFHKEETQSRPFHIKKYAIDLPRDLLYDRINQRVDTMLEQGLVDEVRSLLPYRGLNALNTVGYSELFDHFDGKIDLPTAITLIKQNTRHFAKRQLTWFRRDSQINWLNFPFDQHAYNFL
jgi:tRNA dimethylallyltransferase